MGHRGGGVRGMEGAMRTQASLARLCCQILVTALAAVALAAPLAQAQEPDEPAQRKPYFGGYWGLQAHTGLVVRADAAEGDTPGPALGVSARLASILSLADVQARLLASTYDATASDGRVAAVTRLSVGPEIKGHPLFIVLLRGDWLALLLSSFYVSGGADLDVVSVDADGAGRTRVGLGLHLGAGLDLPLTDRHRPQGLWLGAAYQLKLLTLDTGVPGVSDFTEHTALLTLGWRWHDLSWARVPRPGELQDQ